MVSRETGWSYAPLLRGAWLRRWQAPMVLGAPLGRPVARPGLAPLGRLPWDPGRARRRHGQGAGLAVNAHQLVQKPIRAAGGLIGPIEIAYMDQPIPVQDMAC